MHLLARSHWGKIFCCNKAWPYELADLVPDAIDAIMVIGMPPRREVDHGVDLLITKDSETTTASAYLPSSSARPTTSSAAPPRDHRPRRRSFPSSSTGHSDSEARCASWGVTRHPRRDRGTDLQQGVTIPLPSPDEQRAIAEFLDHGPDRRARGQGGGTHPPPRGAPACGHHHHDANWPSGRGTGEHDVTRWGSRWPSERGSWRTRLGHEQFNGISPGRAQSRALVMLSLTVEGHLI